MDEKNSQVAQMGAIYSRASTVLVWLGLCDDEIAATLLYVRTAPEPQSLSETPVRGLFKLLQSPWWQRIWVVQEIYLAATEPVVCCGNERWSWSLMVDMTITAVLCDLRILHADDKLKDARTLMLFAAGKPGTTKILSLGGTLSRTCNRLATVPHDHVYALYGLVYGERQMHLRTTIDYSAPERIAFQDAMLAVFNEKGDLSWLLNTARGGVFSARHIPSWCVDFSTNWMKTVNRLQWYHRNRHPEDTSDDDGPAAESAGEPLRMRYNKDEGTIGISKIQVGRVRFASMATSKSREESLDSPTRG
jgi:hypothetical protein